MPVENSNNPDRDAASTSRRQSKRDSTPPPSKSIKIPSKTKKSPQELEGAEDITSYQMICKKVRDLRKDPTVQEYLNTIKQKEAAEKASASVRKWLRAKADEKAEEAKGAISIPLRQKRNDTVDSSDTEASEAPIGTLNHHNSGHTSGEEMFGSMSGDHMEDYKKKKEKERAGRRTKPGLLTQDMEAKRKSSGKQREEPGKTDKDLSRTTRKSTGGHRTGSTSGNAL